MGESLKIYQLEMVPYFPVHGQKTRYGPSDWSLTGIYPITLLMVGLINISGMPYLCLARWVYQHPTQYQGQGRDITSQQNY